jgi:hypothetical protein
MHWRSLVLIAAVLLVSACASKPPPPPRAPAAAVAPVLTDPAAACLAGLDQRHADYDRITDFHNGEGCGIDQAVKLKGLAIPLNRPLLLACPTAVSLADFEAQVVIPAAQATLGHAVSTVTSAGSYDCRAQRGDHPERLSEHALGKAIDITGFTMADGTRITVLQNWSGKDAKAEFLHQVASGACKMFSVVLTPKSNRLHRDHLHLDNGPYKKCDA